jgi:hypothetical protein
MPATAADRRRAHLTRQIDHWTDAAVRLARLEDLAGPGAWGFLEEYLGVSVRGYLRAVVERMVRRGEVLRRTLESAETDGDFALVQRQLLAFRRHYLRAETTVDFFADAINTRTNPVQGGLLRACDTLAHRSMAGILDPLGYDTPIALTYVDKGLGASILKAGLRLWDGGALSPAAAIKIVRHNLHRPTALVHEAGHQVAHITGWNGELARTIEQGLAGSGPLAAVWAGWSSEIAADAVAFVHTGFGSVLALHDVLAGEPGFVFQVVDGDPHPMSFLRLQLGIEMCRLAWGGGPWDDLAGSWRDTYPLSLAASSQRALVAGSARVLPEVARLTLAAPARAFRGRRLVDVVPPSRVSPQALAELELRLGPALYTSSHWIWTECLRLLAISALRAGDEPPAGAGPGAAEAARVPIERWMLRLGGVQQAA